MRLKEFVWWKEELRRQDEKHPEITEIIAANIKQYLDSIEMDSK